MLLHIELVNNRLKIGPHSFDGGRPLLLNLAACQTSVLNVPRSISENAIGLPDVDQLLANNTGVDRTVVGETMTNGNDQFSGTRRDILSEQIGSVAGRLVAFINEKVA